LLLTSFPTRRSSDLELNTIGLSVRQREGNTSSGYKVSRVPRKLVSIKYTVRLLPVGIQLVFQMLQHLLLPDSGLLPSHSLLPKRSEEHTSELQSRFD